jgi:hypothetical protein
VLEPWIIEQIRRREEEERRRHERPRLEIPLGDERRRPDPPDPTEGEESEEDRDAPQRGVVIIDM